MNIQSVVLLDQTGQPHTLAIGENALLLDGAAAAIFALEDNQVTLRSSTETISFSYTTLGLAILGDSPTPGDVGLLLAQYLGRWSAIHALVASLQSFQACVGQITTEAQPWLTLPLPEYRFDELTRRALDAFDGTEETTRTLAHILNQSPETITAWAHQIGKAVLDAPALSPPSIDEHPVAATHRHEEKADQAVMEPTSRRFRWTQEQVEHLEADFLNSPIKGVVACMHDIADRRGWPYNSIQAKLYELKLPQQKEQKKSSATGREAETSAQEDHPSDQNTSNDAAAD